MYFFNDNIFSNFSSIPLLVFSRNERLSSIVNNGIDVVIPDLFTSFNIA